VRADVDLAAVAGRKARLAADVGKERVDRDGVLPVVGRFFGRRERVAGQKTRRCERRDALRVRFHCGTPRVVWRALFCTRDAIAEGGRNRLKARAFRRTAKAAGADRGGYGSPELAIGERALRPR